MTRKTGLGRGLDALIGGDTQPAANGVLSIPVDQIKRNPRQPRSSFNSEELESLAASIREHGVLQPVILTFDPQDQEQYILIAGERRWLAAKQAGLTHIPAILREVTDQERLELALIENVQRADLGPLETAMAYRQLVDEFNLTHQEIAERVFKSRTAVTNTLRLLNLTNECQSALTNGLVSEGHARALLVLQSPGSQDNCLHIVLQRGLNVRQTEELVKFWGQPKPGQKIAPALPVALSAVEERLRGRLGTKVRLNHGNKGGTIVIHYYSDEELNALVERLVGEE